MDILETLFSCGIIMQAKYCPQVVHNDPYDHFLVVEITHSDEVMWLVGFMALTTPVNVLDYGSLFFQF